MVKDYWCSLSATGRILLIVTLALCGLWLVGIQPRGGTTASGLDTVMLYGGRITWKHRSRRDADYINAVGAEPGFIFLGTGEFRSYTMNGGHIDTLALTLWPFILLSAIVPFRSFLRFRKMRERNRRIAAGHCSACGYDVRGLQDRCPECGQTIAAASSDELAPRTPTIQEEKPK